MTPVIKNMAAPQGFSSLNKIHTEGRAAATTATVTMRFKITGKKVVSSIMLHVDAIIIWDAMFVSPENRLSNPILPIPS
jgi:hypothetical protein